MEPRPFAIGVYAGGSMPTGDFKNVADVGYHAGAFGSATLSGNFSVRLDGAYSDFGSKTVTATDAVATFGTTLFQTTLDAQYDLGSQTEIAAGGGSIPYVSGGAGFYRFSYDDTCTGPSCISPTLEKSETRFGINVGAGATFFLSGFTPFVDIRYHSISPRGNEARANMILGSFGLKF
jgi:opacity protein-like surface antigen